MSNIFDFAPIADVAKKLAKNAVNNVVDTDDNKSLPNIQLPDKVIENVRNTWNNLVNTNQTQEPQIVSEVERYKSDQRQPSVEPSKTDYYQALKISNQPEAGGLAVNTLPGSDILEKSSMFSDGKLDDIKNDFLTREAEQGRLTPQFNLFNSNDFNQIQKDYLANETSQFLPVRSLGFPNISQESIDAARDDYLENEANQLPAKFDFSLPSFSSLDQIRQDYENRQANQPLPQLSMNLPTPESFKQAQDDYFEREAASKTLPTIDVKVPSLELFDQAQRDYFDRQSQQPRIDLPSIENFDALQRDYFNREANQPMPKSNIELPSNEDFNKIQQDYFNTEAGQSPAAPEITLPSLDSFNQAQADYFNREANQSPAKLDVDLPSVESFDQAQRDFFERQAQQPVAEYNFPSREAFEQAQQDFFSRQSENPTPDFNINIPSYESFKQAKEDFDSRPEPLYEPLKNLTLSNDSDLDAYNKFFESKGGIDKNYEGGINDVSRGLLNMSLLNNSVYDRGEIPGLSTVDDVSKGLDKISKETIDDGTMREENLKSKYMTLPVYKEYVKAGFGGRSLEELENMPEGSIFNKVDEARDHGFRPYVTDAGQFANWSLTQAADDTTKAYNVLGQTRNLTTDAKVNYNGQQYSRDDFYDNVGEYFEDINKLKESGKIEIIDADDPSVNLDTDLPMTCVWSFPGTDITVSSNDDLMYQWSEDGTELYCWLPGHEDQAVVYSGNTYEEALQDYDDHRPGWNWYRSEPDDEVHSYWRIPKLEYKQKDGSTVSLSYSDAEKMAVSMAEGTADMDWGPLNLAKDANDRKGFADMFTTGDFSDLAPNMVDLTLGSAPLFNPISAWPMAISNGVTATQGLDPRLYDAENNTRYQLSDDMNGEKYLANIGFSTMVPMTERFAGVIGGSGGFLGKPLQSALKKVGAPAAARSAVDVLGEGVEEDVASAWEDYQVNGLQDWFANPVYETDEDGNVIMVYNPATQKEEPKKKYDKSGHEVRDPNTPLNERVGNWVNGFLDNTLAGATLGLGIGGPGIAHDALTGSGYYGESRERKLLRDLEKLNGLPRYREAKRGNQTVHIGPESIGTYGKR